MFVAPELYRNNEVSPLNDVWSIGVILYLLITGGSGENMNEEKFDFTEPTWLTVSDELEDFMHGCVAKDPTERMSIKTLQNHEFLLLIAKLNKDPIDSVNSLYKFQVASAINQVVHRKMSLNNAKIKQIESVAL